MYTLGGNWLHCLGDKYAYFMWDLAFHWRVVQIIYICMGGFGSWVCVCIYGLIFCLGDTYVYPRWELSALAW